jgi:hypothetical protein
MQDFNARATLLLLLTVMLTTATNVTPFVAYDLPVRIEGLKWPIDNASQLGANLKRDYIGSSWALLRQDTGEIDPVDNDATLECPAVTENATRLSAAEIAHTLINFQPPDAFQLRDSQSSAVRESTAEALMANIKTIVDTEFLLLNYSLVYKPEFAELPSIVDRTAGEALAALLGTAISSHTYISNHGAYTLKPHSEVRGQIWICL